MIAAASYRSGHAAPAPCLSRPASGGAGTAPAVTGANAVLARINADHPIGLKHLQPLDLDEARTATGGLGRQIGLGMEETAEAILTAVNQRRAGRTRLLSVEQGHDPHDFMLVAFDGAGPLHGAAIMREVGVRTMLIPPHPGVLCALGCAIADTRYDQSRTVEGRVGDLDPAWAGIPRTQRREGETRLAERETVVECSATVLMAGARQADVRSLRGARMS